MITRNFKDIEDNFELESRLIEFRIQPEITFDDLSDEEKNEIFCDFATSFEQSLEKN